MRFEAREIKPYAEPVSAADLDEGSVYFAVNYVPGDMVTPVMETLVFIGRNLDVGDQGKVYFQDVRSYRNGIRHDQEASDESDTSQVRGEVFAAPANQINHIFEYERALDNLIRCSLRRTKMDTEVPVRLEGRELKPFAEPVSAPELHEGEAYFSLTYVDDEMLIPVMETRVFIGENLEPGDERKSYFQDVDSYHDGTRYKPADKDEWATFYIESETELKRIFKLEQALEELMRCSLRRRKA